jgi:hypothetical protein
MIRSGLYTRLVLLGNGDEVRRCRDAHTEGQTIEESLRVSPECWSRRFNSNQVPLIPASRRHDYANDLPPPSSWLPPFFFHLPSPAPNQNKTVQRSGLRAVPPLRCSNAKYSCPINTRSSHFRACIFPSSKHCIWPFISCPLPPHSGHEFRVPFSRDFRPRSSRRDKGVRL